MTDPRDAEQLETVLASDMGRALVRSNFEALADESAEMVLDGASDDVKELYESASTIADLDSDDFAEALLEDPGATIELLEAING